jgi:hypothetical protein
MLLDRNKELSLIKMIIRLINFRAILMMGYMMIDGTVKINKLRQLYLLSLIIKKLKNICDFDE